jgi:putative oxidoreductase
LYVTLTENNGRDFAIKRRKTMAIALWIVQILLALAFLLAGFMKVSQPIDNLKKNMNWVAHTSPGIVRLIGTLEILGALGLILPAVTHILPWLTPVAAVGLVLTMIGAAIFHVRLKEFSALAAPLILLLLALFIVYGRFLVVPLS